VAGERRFADAARVTSGVHARDPDCAEDEKFRGDDQPVVASCRLPERLRCAYFGPMKTLALELPDPLAAALDDAVVDGGFRDAGEVAREALRDYLSHRRFALQERHQLDDIAAALAEVKPLPPPR
jgi:Arc/MetJ-type ribon-helix-helix transcriptional regulator